MIELCLIRHGLTDWNVSGRLQGWMDIPLNHTGQKQARRLAKRLTAQQFSRIYSSDLCRAMQTAEIILAASDHKNQQPEIIQCPALREISFGAWEGLTYQEIFEQYPQAAKTWQSEIASFAPPGGESLDQLVKRVTNFFVRLKEEYSSTTDHTRVLLVAHGGSLQVLLCLALGIPVEQYWQLHLEPCSICELKIYTEGAILNRLNG